MSRKAPVNSGTTGAALNYPGARVRHAAAAAAPPPHRPRPADARRTDKAVIFYPRNRLHEQRGAVSEGSLKPKSELTFDMITETVRTIAHLMDVSLRMLDDVGYIRSYIENRMTYGLKLKEEIAAAHGLGHRPEPGRHLHGRDGVQPALRDRGRGRAGPRQTSPRPLQVELAEAFATGIVLHPTDWAGIELLKDANHQYLFTNPQNTTTGRIWGRDVVSTQAMSQGTFRSVTSRSTRRSSTGRMPTSPSRSRTRTTSSGTWPRCASRNASRWRSTARGLREGRPESAS